VMLLCQTRSSKEVLGDGLLRPTAMRAAGRGRIIGGS
jgi:hypothetical protein